MTSSGEEGSSPPAAETSTEIVTVVKQEQTVTDTENSELNDVVLRMKEEEEEEEVEEATVNAVSFGGYSLLSEMAALPKPLMKGLDETFISPFLRKMFEIVDDPETDRIVSWNPTRNSFIVWDCFKFSENLLPKYFKHKNFSSFVRQLNTYGFRKVDSDRWEFANEGFQGGKRHLLKNIKRKSRSNGNKPQQSLDVNPISSSFGLGTEIESLKEDQSLLRSEILRLKQQQEESHNQLAIVQEKIFRAELKQQHILNFLVKVAKDRRFLQILMNKRKQQKRLDGGEILKKPKLLRSQETEETLPDDTDGGLIHEHLAAMQTELGTNMPLENPSLGLSAGDEEFYGCVHDHGEENTMFGLNMVMSLSREAMSDELMEDGLITGTEDTGDITLSDSKIYMELEDLIGKTHARGSCVNGMV